MFELSATLATVQAEAHHSVAQVRHETTLQIQKMQQELRRSQQEATLLRHDLHSTRNGTKYVDGQQPRVAPVVSSTTTNTSTTTDNKNETTQSPLPITTSTTSLALYLLSTCTPLAADAPPPPLIVAAANNHTITNNNMDTNTTTFVWQLTEYCLQRDTRHDWWWWKQAMIWSTCCRTQIRASLCTTKTRRNSRRIVLSNTTTTTTTSDLCNIATALKEPLACNVPAFTCTYVQDLHRRLWKKLTTSCHYLDLVQVVLMNATREEYNVLAWQPLVASPNSPIGTLLLSSAVKLLGGTHTLCGLRYKKYTTTATTITTEHVDDNDDLETLCTALHIVSQSWPLDNNNQEWQHGMIQMLLDVLGICHFTRYREI